MKKVHGVQVAYRAKYFVEALDAAGFAIVPKVPTDEMVAAMKPLTDGPPTRRWQWIWNKLIAAAARS